MRRRDVGRGAAPAGKPSQGLHSGRIGAPPGANTGPRQELPDDLASRSLRARQGQSKAGPGAE